MTGTSTELVENVLVPRSTLVRWARKVDALSDLTVTEPARETAYQVASEIALQACVRLP